MDNWVEGLLHLLCRVVLCEEVDDPKTINLRAILTRLHPNLLALAVTYPKTRSHEVWIHILKLLPVDFDWLKFRCIPFEEFEVLLEADFFRKDTARVCSRFRLLVYLRRLAPFLYRSPMCVWWAILRLRLPLFQLAFFYDLCIDHKLDLVPIVILTLAFLLLLINSRLVVGGPSILGWWLPVCL